MRLLHTRITLILATLISIVCGCEEKEQSSLTLDKYEIEAQAKGGKLTITYQISGSQSDSPVRPESQEEWINGFDTSKAGIIDFNVDVNDSPEPREGTITIRYAGQEASATVRQAGYASEFEIVASSTSSSIAYCIVPKDKSMTYLYSIMDKETYSKFATPEDIFKEEIARHRENAEKFGKTLEEYLEGLLNKGDSKVTTIDLIMPSTEYYIYVYGLDPDGTRTTNVTVSSISTKEIEKIDTDFTIAQEMNGNIVSFSITPGDMNQNYIWQIVKTGELSDDLLTECQKEIFEKVMSCRNNGMTDNDILSYLSVKGKTEKEMKLDICTDYTIYAIAIDNSFVLVTDPEMSQFKTPDEEVSDNVLTMEIKDIRGHYAKCCITPSNEDTYVVFCKEYVEWKDMTDEEILESLTLGKDLTNKRTSGYYEIYSRGFKEKTEYAFVAFGYNNKMATTKLFKAVFTTAEAEVSKEISMDLSFDKYYDGTELEKMYPDKFAGASGLAVLPVKATVEGYAIDFYYLACEGDLTETKTDDELIQELIYKGIRGESEKALYIPFDKLHTVIGSAVDINGDYTKVIREKITLTKDGVTPAEEYPAE